MSANLLFPQWIKQRRKALDLTQADLAKRVGCAVVTIQKFEEGQRRPSKQIAELLADHLVIPPAERDHFVQVARTPIGEAEHAPTNLPHPLTPLVGRSDDLQRVSELMLRSHVRLLTLVGTPGVGKTRLAVAAGHALRAHFADGVFFVGLAAVTDPTFIFAALAQVLGIREGEQSTLQQVIISYLRPQQVLLVLDNFEHLEESSPQLAELLQACPSLKALVTSRVPLRLTGEHEYTVKPFPLPSADLPPVTLAENPAIHLFMDRVQGFQPSFGLTADNVETVARLCTLLDGLPLAIELAAARCREFTPHQVVMDLSGENSHFYQLADGPRDLPPRQRTLRSAIDWSYTLLSPAEQKLFVQLAPFVGGFDLAAMQAVAEAGVAAADTLQALVAKSLVQMDPTPTDGTRYLLLETLRGFALEKLAASGEVSVLRLRHAEYMLAVAQSGHPIFSAAPDESRWLSCLLRHQENLRAALGWSLESAPDLALKIAAASAHFWYVHGQWREGTAWLEAALRYGQESVNYTPATHARALTGLGVLLSFQGNHTQAQICYRQALQVAATVDASAESAWSFFNLGRSVVMQGDLDEGWHCYDRSQAIWRGLGMTWHVALAQTQRAIMAIEQCNFAQARLLLAESEAIHRTWDAQGSIAAILILRGNIEREDGDPALAIRPIYEGMEIFASMNRSADIAWAERDLGIAYLLASNPEEAARHLQDALAIYQTVGSKDGEAIVLEGLAGVAAMRQQFHLAARLSGAAAALRAHLGLSAAPYSQRLDRQIIAPLRRSFHDWTHEMERGKQLTSTQVEQLTASIAQPVR